MITSELKKNNPFIPDQYYFKGDDSICPSCRTNIAKEINRYIEKIEKVRMEYIDMSDKQITCLIKSKSSYGLTFNDLSQILVKDIPDRAYCHMHPTTFLFLKTLRDSLGNYIIDYYGNEKFRLFGYPIIEDLNMCPIDSVRSDEIFIKFLNPTESLSFKIQIDIRS